MENITIDISFQFLLLVDANLGGFVLGVEDFAIFFHGLTLGFLWNRDKFGWQVDG
jgi:hypothetical protein